MPRKIRRFDHCWNDVLRYHGLMAGYYNAARCSIHRARRNAFRFARALAEAQNEWPNELAAMIASMKMGVDEWMDEHFLPIEQMGDDRNKLLHSIGEGMTEKDYVEHGPLWAAVRNPRTAAKEVRRDPIGASAPPEVLRARIKAQGEEIKELRITVRELLRENALLRRSYATINRTIKKLTA